MSSHWWHLPGPARFLQSVIQDLRSGKNVVVAFPPFGPAGFREALAERVRENDLWRWQTICATECPADQVASLTYALHRRLVPGWKTSELYTPVTLAQQLTGTIVWIDNAKDLAWGLWSKFLEQYQHACQNCDPGDRSLFCLAVTGSPEPAPVADVALAIRRWEGVVSRLDMTLYLDRLLHSRFRNPLHHKVVLAVVVELAGSDSHLGQQLAKEDLPIIMDPTLFLADFATSRGWALGPEPSGSWEEGTLDIVDTTNLLHSAAVAAKGNRAEVLRRVWRGQVTSLYPFIEEQRVKIIPQVRGYIRLPVDTTYGTVDNADDLELGQLLYFLRGKRIHARTWRLLNHLTEMRHALAHLQPVPVRSLLADEIMYIET